MEWLREVEGRLFRSGPDELGRSAWVAVVNGALRCKCNKCWAQSWRSVPVAERSPATV